MLHTIQSRYGDICEKIVADVGCGTGMLSVGSCLLGAQYVVLHRLIFAVIVLFM